MCPYIGSTRNFILLEFKEVFSLLITHNQQVPGIQPLFLLTSVVWVTIKPNDPAKRHGDPGSNDCHPYQSQQRLEEERSGSSWLPNPLIVKLWQVCGVLGWAERLMGSTKVDKWQLECYNQEGLSRYNRSGYQVKGWWRSFHCSSAINCH